MMTSGDIGSAAFAVPMTGCLSGAQAALVAAALPGFAGRWSLERHCACDGDLMLVLMHEREGLADFTLDAITAGINLGALRDDVLSPVGRFATIEEAIVVLRALVGAEVAGA